MAGREFTPFSGRGQKLGGDPCEDEDNKPLRQSEQPPAQKPDSDDDPLVARSSQSSQSSHQPMQVDNDEAASICQIEEADEEGSEEDMDDGLDDPTRSPTAEETEDDLLEFFKFESQFAEQALAKAQSWAIKLATMTSEQFPQMLDKLVNMAESFVVDWTLQLSNVHSHQYEAERMHVYNKFRLAFSELEKQRETLFRKTWTRQISWTWTSPRLSRTPSRLIMRPSKVPKSTG